MSRRRNGGNIKQGAVKEPSPTYNILQICTCSQGPSYLGLVKDMAIRWSFWRIFELCCLHWRETESGWPSGSSVGPGSGCRGPWSGLSGPSIACTSSGPLAGRPACCRRGRVPPDRSPRRRTWPALRLRTEPFCRHQTPIVTKQPRRGWSLRVTTPHYTPSASAQSTQTFRSELHG